MNATPAHCSLPLEHRDGRRALLKSTLGIAALSISGASLFGVPRLSEAAALTGDMRNKLTPDQIIALMQQGNERFRTGKMFPHDYLAQKRATAAGQ
jgi:carbonic anhydrase